ncbi:unnamed protein product [Caenorhabditis auriculariae]|uniref:Uncharacterized protein n=1 Tax=Caenorhabditis auriculariae TaxID=2777116 RepID=A0A8S1H2U6_9PELO|nr:unnamed protein product [Caenorhabditis auriculariae]
MNHRTQLKLKEENGDHLVSKYLECHEKLDDHEPSHQNASKLIEEAWMRDRNAPAIQSFVSKHNHTPFSVADVNIVNAMSHCSPDEIADLIRGIHNSVYALGIEEARQFRRSKVLGVLKPSSEPPKAKSSSL